MKASGDLVIGKSGDRKKQLFTKSQGYWGKSINLVQNAWNVLCATLAEIFDESSYERFLERTLSSRSKESYRDFMREREAVSARRPRCC